MVTQSSKANVVWSLAKLRYKPGLGGEIEASQPWVGIGKESKSRWQHIGIHDMSLNYRYCWIKRRCRDWILIFCASGPDLLTSLLQTAEQLRCNWVPCSNPPKPPTTTQAQLLSLLENFVCFPLRQELLNFWPRNLATCSKWCVLSAWSCLEVVLTSNSDNSRGWSWQLKNIEFPEARSYIIVPLVIYTVIHESWMIPMNNWNNFGHRISPWLGPSVEANTLWGLARLRCSGLLLDVMGDGEYGEIDRDG